MSTTMWSPVRGVPVSLDCGITRVEPGSTASRAATIADFSRRKSTITEEQLDLTVDYDSEVEDSLPPNVRVGREFQDEIIGKCIKKLGYENKLGRFWEYYIEVHVLLPDKERDNIVQYLGKYGLQEWFRFYVVHRKEPIQKLLYAFGVLLSEEQRKWDDLALLPLLKAAAVRRMRRRDLATPYALHSNPQEHAVNGVLNRIKAASRIVVVTGAGISVSCGIPDFRSQNGLYSQLFSSGAYDLDDPQQMFDINFFKRNPSMFYTFAHKIYPSQFTPSPSHRFIRAIEKRGKLLRNYTQNIDTLEGKAGIKRVLQCHGSFSTATCINCYTKVPGETIKDDLLAQRVPLCKVCNSEDELKPKKMRRKKKKKKRNDGWESDEPEETISLPAGVIKPDITFFGEKLSTEFDKKVLGDAKRADLVLIIGTSLKVRPVSEIITHMRHGLDIIVINKTPLTHIQPSFELYGDADTIVNDLARRLGWSLKPEIGDQRSLNDASARSHARPRRVPGASGQKRADIQLLRGKKRNIALYDGADCDEVLETFDEGDVERSNIDLMETSSESELAESESESDLLANGTVGHVKKKQRTSPV